MNATVQRLNLLNIVKKNREQHKAVVEEATENYRSAAIAELKQAIADAKSGKRIWRASSLRPPMNQTADYDRAIRMLEMNTLDVVELEESEFSQLVLGKWNWAGQFTASNSRYVTSDTGKSYLASLGEGQED